MEKQDYNYLSTQLVESMLKHDDELRDVFSIPLVGCFRIFASFHVNLYSSKKGGGLSTGNCNGLSFEESVNVTWRSSTDTSQQVYNSCLVL